MTTPTVGDYITRVRAIIAAVPGVGTDVTDGAVMTAVPGFEVYAKGAQHRREGRAGRHVVTRPLSLRVYYVFLDTNDLSKEPPISGARGTVQSAIDTYADALYRSVSLSNGADAGVALVGETMTDSMGLMTYNNRVYFGFDLDFEITYNRA